MTTTVADLLNLALKDAGVLGEGETASGEMAVDALTTLGQMLALWQIDNVYVYAQQVISFSPTGAVSYTVGTGANINTTRPEKIDAAYWRSGGVDYPIRLFDTFEQYEALRIKTETGETRFACYLPSYTTGTLYVFPQVATGDIYLVTQARLPQPTTAATDLTLPPEYMLPVRANLAVLFCGMYGKPVNPVVAGVAQTGLKLLKRNNLRIQPLSMPAAIPSKHNPNIIAGY